MAFTLYKPNKMNKGSLISFKFLAKQNKKDEEYKEGCFYINMVKQVSWNESSHTGSFKGGDSISVKLSLLEAATILHVLERNWNLGDISKMDRDALRKQYGFTGTHTGNNQTVYINFAPWQRQGAPEQTGFGLYVTKVSEGKENSTFGVAFGFGDDIALREYLKLGLEHINMAAYAEDKRRFEENMNAKQNGGGNGGGGYDEAPAKSAPRGRTRKPVQSEPVEQDSSSDSPAEDNSDEALF